MKQRTSLFETSGAFFSPCERYRYTLWREWGEGPVVNFLMCNPSTATAAMNDPTIERCQRRSQQWGFGGLKVTNLFALRSTDPLGLLAVDDPVGQDNPEAVLTTATEVDLVVCAWGSSSNPQLKRLIAGRAEETLAVLRRAGVALSYLRMGKEQPCHPLYLPYSAQPLAWFFQSAHDRTGGGEK